MHGHHRPTAAGPQAVDEAYTAMSGTQDTRTMLGALRVCSSRLDPDDTESIDRLTRIALDIFGLDADEVQAAIAGGQRDRDDEAAERHNTNGGKEPPDRGLRSSHSTTSRAQLW
jgi:hypothetical protein